MISDEEFDQKKKQVLGL
ncbi:hypothetical protein ACFLTC_03025 [Chloroflexota bacterium]